MALLDSEFLCGDTIVGDDVDHIDTRAEVADVHLTVMVAGQNIASVDIEDLHFDNAFTLHGHLILGGIGIDDSIGAVHLVDTERCWKSDMVASRVSSKSKVSSLFSLMT